MKYHWKSKLNFNEMPIKISKIYYKKSNLIFNEISIEIHLKFSGNPVKFNRNVTEIPMEISIKNQWRSIENQVKI